MISPWLPGWRGHLLVLLAGMSLTLAFAPYSFWPLSVLSPALLALSLRTLNGRQAMWRCFWFGLGLYTTGVSWVYVSIYKFGYASMPLAVLLTGIFVAALALVFSLPFYLFGRWFNGGSISLLLGFPACWVLGEWFRSWFLTGFPWLYLGSAHLHTWLAGWAPVAGVYGITLACTLGAATLALSWSWLRRHNPGPALLAIGCAGTLWPLGLGLRQIDWTHTDGNPVKIGMAQGNIPQEMKWRPDFLQPTLSRYQNLSEPLWDNDWVIWPEAAVPMLYHGAVPFLEEMHNKAAATHTAFITGILYDDYYKQAYYNSIIGLGLGAGIYHKRRLVPFGEYVPLDQWLRGVIAFFDLPTSIITPGPADQRGLQIGTVQLAPFICYEVVYPDLVAESAARAQVLITISNDAWFGDSIGPLQHLEMAQMRALETGRFLIRATNNGISAIVDTHGRIIRKSEQFVQQSLEGEIQPMAGITPFMRFGSLPVTLLCLLFLAASFYYRRRELMTASPPVDSAGDRCT
ncbi:MAG: apolipoprotein N-acyltransferase [Exilibacterium sp.]